MVDNLYLWWQLDAETHICCHCCDIPFFSNITMSLKCTHYTNLDVGSTLARHGLQKRQCIPPSWTLLYPHQSTLRVIPLRSENKKDKLVCCYNLNKARMSKSFGYPIHQIKVGLALLCESCCNSYDLPTGFTTLVESSFVIKPIWGNQRNQRRFLSCSAFSLEWRVYQFYHT
jgi:hypothetical protein